MYIQVMGFSEVLNAKGKQHDVVLFAINVHHI